MDDEERRRLYRIGKKAVESTVSFKDGTGE